MPYSSLLSLPSEVIVITLLSYLNLVTRFRKELRWEWDRRRLRLNAFSLSPGNEDDLDRLDHLHNMFILPKILEILPLHIFADRIMTQLRYFPPFPGRNVRIRRGFLARPILGQRRL